MLARQVGTNHGREAIPGAATKPESDDGGAGRSGRWWLRGAVVVLLAAGILLAMGIPAGIERPSVRYLRLDDGAAETTDRRVALNHAISGDVDSYRASERRDLRGASWTPYSATPNFMLGESGKSRRTVYFQVRRGSAVSNIASDSIRLTDPTVELLLPIGQVYRFALEQGWRFYAEPLSPMSDCRIRVFEDRLVLSARQGAPQVDGGCRFQLFDGDGELNGRWRFLHQVRSKSRYDHCRFRFRRLPSAGGPAIGYQLRIEDLDNAPDGKGYPADGVDGCTYVVEAIAISGPPDEYWREAFRR